MFAKKTKLLSRLRHAIRSRIDHYPIIYLSLCRLRPKTGELTVSKNTEIVIEGFPRSANTFAVAAFTFAQGRPVKIARHIHAPAQVIAAVRMGIPTLVLIRHPRDAVASLLIRIPHLSVEQALKNYIRFYITIMPYRGKYVIGTFHQATQNFGVIINEINSRFGTQFNLFEQNQENVGKVFEIVEQMDRDDRGLSHVQENTVARPSEFRQKLKAKAFESFEVKELLAEAERIYRQFVAS